MDWRKPIFVNQYESLTHTILEKVASRYQARIFSKVRVADVLNMQKGTLPDEEFYYGLKAHFDFVVAEGTEQALPLFAVELDGKQHYSNSKAIERDRLKNNICERLNMPILRIDTEYINREIQGFTLLSWLTELWFLQKGFYEAQERGEIPFDEDFYYASLFDFGYWEKGKFNKIPFDSINEEHVELFHTKGISMKASYDLSSEARIYITALHHKGLCSDISPKTLYASMPENYVVAVSVICVAEEKYMIGEARCRLFKFPPILTHQLAKDLSVAELGRKLRLYMKGKHEIYSPKQAKLKIKYIETLAQKIR